jgi:tetratricopeptide (TPR) repeat protein
MTLNVNSEALKLYEQGIELRIGGDYDPATECLKQAIEADPNFARAHMELGLVYCFSGYFDESIAELELARGLDPCDSEIILNLAKTYTMLGMFDEGEATFRSVLEMACEGDKIHDEAQKQLGYYSSFSSQ